ncbi:MAG TPA: hypothetical protein VGL46_12660 [Pseudonocardiaceae bacterium]|jgi:hypothetical protein
MAVIRANLTVLNLLPATSSPGWTLQGHLPASFRELTTVLHSPDFGVSDIEDATLWQLGTPAGGAQLYHQLDGAYFLHSPDTRVTWTIQAPSAEVLPWIFKLVRNSTADFPRSVQALPAGPDRIILIRAYQKYLDLRAADLKQRLQHSFPSAHPATTARWEQLVSARRDLGRALHLAVTPHDVVAALQQVSNRIAATTVKPAFDHELHREFAETVRALATAADPVRPGAA